MQLNFIPVKTILLLSALVFNIFVLSAQFDHAKFDMVFEEEEPEENVMARDNHSFLYVHTVPRQLPQWFFNPPYSDSTIISMGISDPGMDSASAMNLAILRAKVLGNVLNRSTTKMLCEFYSDDLSGAMTVSYEKFTRISSKGYNNNCDYKVINSHRTVYDETVVLVEFIPSEVPDTVKSYNVIMESYSNETEVSVYANYESVNELLVKGRFPDNDTLLLYQSTQLGYSFDVINLFDTAGIKIPIYNLSYINPINTDSVEYVYYSHGLWKEYYKGVTVSIIGAAREKPENISNLSEKHNSYKELTKGISKNVMSFSFLKNVFTDSGIYVLLNENE